MKRTKCRLTLIIGGKIMAPALGLGTQQKAAPIPESLLKEWEAYLDQISVCDNRDPKRPCP